MQNTESNFIQLLEQHKGILYRIVHIYAFTREDKKDLQQDIIYQLWKSLPSFREESQFSTWMYRVAVNTSITYIKREKRRIKPHFSENFPQIRDIEYDATDDLQMQAFYKAVQYLKPLEKTVIFLFLENMPHKEIANNLGISEVNARVKLNRAKEKIKYIIKKNGYGL